MKEQALTAKFGSANRPLKIGDIEIPCYVLDDGTRILTQFGFYRAIGRSGRPAKGRGGGFEKTPDFLAINYIKPFVDSELTASTKPIQFTLPTGGTAWGYKAELLPKVCEVYLRARDANALTEKQERFAIACDIVMRGLAHVGIIALVDEATGYQEFRARHALEAILEKFIAKELRPWAKTFPDEFYEQMFRLRGWRYDPSTVKRPQVIGHLTNDVIYSRLAPGVLKELRKKEPKDNRGRRKHQLHRWTTEDIGHPKLREHLASVITLMKVAPDKAWRKFMSMLNRALPKYGDTISLDLGETDED